MCCFFSFHYSLNGVVQAPQRFSGQFKESPDDLMYAEECVGSMQTLLQSIEGAQASEPRLQYP